MKKYLLASALMLTLNLSAAENTGECIWNELATTNVKAAKEFYGKVFGWEFTETDGGTYTLIRKNSQNFGGIWEIPAAQRNQIPPHWLPFVTVDNVEQSLERARQNGATLIKPVQKVGDMGQFAVIKDPTGAHVAMWQAARK